MLYSIPISTKLILYQRYSHEIFATLFWPQTKMFTFFLRAGFEHNWFPTSNKICVENPGWRRPARVGRRNLQLGTRGADDQNLSFMYFFAELIVTQETCEAILVR